MGVVLADTGIYTLAVVVFLLFNTVSNFTIINSTFKILLNHVIKWYIVRMYILRGKVITIHSCVFLEQRVSTKVAVVLKISQMQMDRYLPWF